MVRLLGRSQINRNLWDAGKPVCICVMIMVIWC